MKNNKIAFIGTGFMASAMIECLSSGDLIANQNIIAVNDAFPESAAEVSQKYGIMCGNAADISDADTVIFAAKPQNVPAIFEMYKNQLTADKLYLSIMAGISTDSIEAAIPGARVIRLMPNLPLSIGCSATAYCLGSAATEADGELTEAIFSSMGVVLRVNEDEMSAVTGLSGSGPAYFYRLTEAMANAAAAWGMDADTAEKLAVQTLIGAAKLLESTGETPSEMRRRVTSKGGTTAAALDAMTDTDFDASVAAAFNAARRRSDELGK